MKDKILNWMFPTRKLLKDTLKIINDNDILNIEYKDVSFIDDDIEEIIESRRGAMKCSICQKDLNYTLPIGLNTCVGNNKDFYPIIITYCPTCNKIENIFFITQEKCFIQYTENLQFNKILSEVRYWAKEVQCNGSVFSCERFLEYWKKFNELTTDIEK